MKRQCDPGGVGVSRLHARGRSAEKCGEVEGVILDALLEPADAAPRPRPATLGAQPDVAATGAARDHVRQNGLRAAVDALVEQDVVATEPALPELVLDGVELVLRQGHDRSVPDSRSALYGDGVGSTVGDLARALEGRRVSVLTGAGCSTESGIPDYRGPDTPPRARAPIQHREFVESETVRRRYWARSMLGWPRIASARPNAAHHALADLERAGVVVGLITQNVDGLHGRAGSREVVELHGALARVRCLGCDARSARDDLQTRLVDVNARWMQDVTDAGAAPDGDADLPDELVSTFRVAACLGCGGVLMPDVVFFGGSVPRPTLDHAWSVFERGEALLVVGSSLTVFSGYRFVRRAVERSLPVYILNQGATRGDPHAALRVDARAGAALRQMAIVLARR